MLLEKYKVRNVGVEILMVRWGLTRVAAKWHVVVIQIKFVETRVTILFMRHLVQG
jgi:hypothetical protein